MKSRTAGLGAVLALALTRHLAQGAMVLNAPFNNSGVWTVATSATSPQTVLGSLSNVYLGYTFNGMTISSGGGSSYSTLQAQNSAAAYQYNVAYAGLGSAISGTPPAQVWVSFLFEDVHTGTAAPANSVLGLFWLDSNTSQSHTEKLNFGFNVESHSGTGEAQLPSGQPSPTVNDSLGGGAGTGSTHLFVAELTGLSSGSYTTLNVWIDPSNSAALAGSPTLTVAGLLAASTLKDIGVRAFVNQYDTLYFGAPEVTTTAQDLYNSVPEPGVFELTGAGLLGLGLLLRRKAQ